MRRRLWLLAVPVVAVALLALPGGAASKITAAKIESKVLKLTATDGDDSISVRVVPGVADPNKDFYEIEDPAGVEELPAGCFRKNANAIHCPVELIKEFEFDLGDGDDEVTIEAEVEDDSYMTGGAGKDNLSGGSGRDDLDGNGGRDILDGNVGADERDGGPGNDLLKGSPGNDVEKGGKGNDKILGGGGRDNLLGGPGGDTLKGGGGNDTLKGGGGSDNCNGGPGQETVVGCETGYAY